MKPGETIPAESALNINEDREAIAISVTNTSDHAVQITSHYHFFEANKRLQFDRTAAYGKRLDVPSGSAVRWQPGETKESPFDRHRGKAQSVRFPGTG